MRMLLVWLVSKAPVLMLRTGVYAGVGLLLHLLLLPLWLLLVVHLLHVISGLVLRGVHVLLLLLVILLLLRVVASRPAKQYHC